MFKDLQRHSHEYQLVSDQINNASTRLTELKTQLRTADTTIECQDIRLQSLQQTISNSETSLLLSKQSQDQIETVTMGNEQLYEKWLSQCLELGQLNEQILATMITITTQKHNYCKDIQKEFESMDLTDINYDDASDASSNSSSALSTGSVTGNCPEQPTKHTLFATNAAFGAIAKKLQSIGIDLTPLSSLTSVPTASQPITTDFVSDTTVGSNVDVEGDKNDQTDENTQKSMQNAENQTDHLFPAIPLPLPHQFLSKESTVADLIVVPGENQFDHLSLLQIRHLYDQLYNLAAPLLFPHISSITTSPSALTLTTSTPRKDEIMDDSDKSGIPNNSTIQGQQPPQLLHRPLFTSNPTSSTLDGNLSPVSRTPQHLSISATTNNTLSINMNPGFQSLKQIQNQPLSQRVPIYKERVIAFQGQIIAQYQNNPVNKFAQLSKECTEIDNKLVHVKRKIIATKRSLDIKRTRIDHLLVQVRLHESQQHQQQQQQQHTNNSRKTTDGSGNNGGKKPRGGRKSTKTSQNDNGDGDVGSQSVIRSMALNAAAQPNTQKQHPSGTKRNSVSSTTQGSQSRWNTNNFTIDDNDGDWS